MGKMLQGSVSVDDVGSLHDGLADSMDGYSDTAKTDDFCLGCFLKGFAEGAVISLVAVAAIAAAPAWLAITLTVGLAAYGAYGLSQIAANWDQYDGNQKSEIAGGMLGGLVGRFGPRIPPKPLNIPGIKLLATPDGQVVPVVVSTSATVPLQGGASIVGAGAGAGTAVMMTTGGGGNGNDDDENNSNDSNANASNNTVQPSGAQGGKPSGRPTKVEGDAATQRSLQRENEAANALADEGYNIEQNPPAKPNGSRPDYRIEGEYFDAYSPGATKSPRGIWSEVEGKVAKGQADRIVLNLDDWGGDMAALEKQFSDWPIADLQEIKIVRGGKVTQFFP
ncbi:MAG: hypothetical protein KF708_00785 [Pirellulales bacterium]|nr:hypothetical protein [Pirellulales bacterium]